MRNGINNNRFLVLVIAIIAGLIFIPLIGNCPLFDWDEINFAECAREMLITNNYSSVQINFQPFWEKPPLFIWMQAGCMKIFGINELSARLPNAINGIISIATLFLIGRKIYGLKFGLFWSLIHAGTLLPTLYFKSGVIDPWFNYFIFLSIVLFLFGMQKQGGQKYLTIGISGLLLGIAVLTKGPAAILIEGLTLFVFILLSRNLQVYLRAYFYFFILVALATSASWFISVYLSGKEFIIEQFIEYQLRLFNTEDSGHSGPILYHVIVLLLGCFPASLLFIMSYKKQDQRQGDLQKNFRLLMLILFWVVLIVFSIVKTKIVHYSSLCYFPLTFVAAYGVTFIKLNQRMNPFFKTLFIIISTVFFILFLAFTQINRFKDKLINSDLIGDKFAKLNLETILIWKGYEWIVPLIFLISVSLIYIAIKQNNDRKFVLGYILQVVFLVGAINIFVPKVELVTQQAAISFYQEMAKHDFYVETNNFKSYAYIFYSDRRPEHYQSKSELEFIDYFYSIQDKEAFKLNYYPTANSYWMKIGKIDKPAFIVSKTPNDKELNEHPDVLKQYSMNGYSFFVRMPSHDK